jgi:hypothetical protein
MRIAAIAFIVLALLIAIIPQFTDCESQGRMLTLANGKEIAMKCHWTAHAELGLSIPLLAVGVTMFLSRRKESRRNLGIVGTTLGIVAVLLPTTLIGVCGNPDMVCNSTMKPALILMGALVIGIGLATVVVSWGPEKEPA